MQDLNALLPDMQESLTKEAQGLYTDKSPKGLYEPVGYILGLRGKRVRPVLCMLAAEAFGLPYHKVTRQALALEVFHNFTLLHDDIMDAADLRRGQETVHKKWDVNTAILSGDAMMIQAYMLLCTCEKSYQADAIALFNKTALEVCEGQQMDMDFEQRETVSLEEYYEMIRLKTAVLLASSLQLGALLAGASIEDQNLIYQFGEELGIAFQIKDDYLDCYGDSSFGKRIGGDILEGKKTFLLNRSYEKASPETKQALSEITKLKNEADKVSETLAIYESLDIALETKTAMEERQQRAFSYLDELSLNESEKDKLRSYALALWQRMS